MIELEGRSAVEALHESLNEFAVALTEQVGAGSVDRLVGELVQKGVQGAVKVHHEKMEAVSRRTVARRDRRNPRPVDLLRAVRSERV